ncbi:EthD family reductase [Pedobacter sp. UBA5917]|jgi:uncharacterized protein (TIGR02118 family)|uniref:EthD family reductase n=1 Tax=Pedobacter sp. UBA5917 TaxID=1947061 RepID=UPI0025CE8299|nr:EthD family reductase [Pedobacter sp. UBA5917]
MNNKTILLLLIFGLSFTTLKAQKSETFTPKKGMYKVTVMYANGPDKKFDMEYYKHTHMPLMAKIFGSGLKHLSIDKGLKNGTPGQPTPFLAIGYLYFENLSAYQEVLDKNAAQIRADFPKYTNITPTVQISEIIQ